MRKTLLLLSGLAVVILASGCANTERKFGRGMSNVIEPLRMGELRRSMEQTALFDGPDAGYATGFIKGLNRTIVRTGVGAYEMITAPIPPYDPIFTDYIAPGPVYPDSYKPSLVSDSTFATDANLGFSGGDVMPIMPGSRFRIFDTH
jgi:putative exosortase-associated protein (TIGR04073 family)